MKNIKTFWKLTAGVAGLVLLLGGVLILLFRFLGTISAEKRGEVAASIVREALTSHMIAGSSQYHGDLLRQIETVEGVRSVWTVRAETLNRQYGKGLRPQEAKDEIDRAVLREGKSYDTLKGSVFSDTFYRLSIPYTASEKGKIDCMGCHDAKPGEVLGVVSIELEINDLKTAGILAGLGSLALLGLFAVSLVRTLRRFLSSYSDPLDAVAAVMEKAEAGDYAGRIDPPESSEGYRAVMGVNVLMEKLESTLSNSSAMIHSLVRIDHPKNDLLSTVHSGIAHLYDLEQYRMAVEKDSTLDEVYTRLISLLRTRWGVDDFTLLELNPISKGVRHIYSGKVLLCDAMNSGCRADRTTGTIDSSVCEGACPKMIDPDIHYICRNYPISDDLDIVFSLQSEDTREIVRLRGVLDQMGDYINVSRLQIINKRLEKSVRIDPLTGFYNRLYLEELSRLVVEQSKRTAIPYGILIVDMDGFDTLNRSYDAQVADEVIKAMGRNIQEMMQPGDVVVRYGSDTFAVVLYDYEPDGVVEIAEAIRGSFKKKIRVNTYAILKTVSVGMAFFPAQTADMNEAVELAKRALLEAKHRGGNCCIAYDPKSMPM